jgi:hypothetical protein
MVFKATEGTMRQAMSGSSRQAVVIGNRPDSFIDTACAAPEGKNGSVDLVGAWEHQQQRARWPPENARRRSIQNRTLNDQPAPRNTGPTMKSFGTQA